MGFFAGIAALCTPIALVVFWIFATRGRRNHPKWEILRRFRYAHRGCMILQGVPENSMAAFRRARAFSAASSWMSTLPRMAIWPSSTTRVFFAPPVRMLSLSSLTVPQLKNYRLEGTQEKFLCWRRSWSLSGRPSPAGGIESRLL